MCYNGGMGMEGQDLESREAAIERMLEDLAREEEIDPEDIFSDLETFAELYDDDPGAAAYLEEVAEKIEISFEEMFAYAQKLREN